MTPQQIETVAHQVREFLDEKLFAPTGGKPTPEGSVVAAHVLAGALNHAFDMHRWVPVHGQFATPEIKKLVGQHKNDLDWNDPAGEGQSHGWAALHGEPYTVVDATADLVSDSPIAVMRDHEAYDGGWWTRNGKPSDPDPRAEAKALLQAWIATEPETPKPKFRLSP